MERVKKGERYWSFLIYTHGYRILEFTEGESYAGNDDFDAECAAFGNYFHTKEEAESMAQKICKVLNGAWVLTPPEGEILSRKVEAILNGAEVIEMPSDIDEQQNKLNDYDSERERYAFDYGFEKAVEIFESKIVK